MFNLYIMAERLKQIRMENNMTQHEAANRVGVSRSTYTSWELGEAEPNALEMLNMCKTFAVSSEYFCGHDDYITITIPKEFDVDLNKYNLLGLKIISRYCKYIATMEEYTK